MVEWGIPFHVVEGEWTDRQFALMLSRLTDRKKREQAAQKDAKSGMVPYQ